MKWMICALLSCFVAYPSFANSKVSRQSAQAACPENIVKRVLGIGQVVKDGPLQIMINGYDSDASLPKVIAKLDGNIIINGPVKLNLPYDFDHKCGMLHITFTFELETEVTISTF